MRAKPMEIDKVIHWVVVHRLLKWGYNPMSIKPEFIGHLASELEMNFTADEIMQEYRRWLQ
jgi:hypothetical protein